MLSYFDAPFALRRILDSRVVGKYLDAFAYSDGAVGYSRAGRHDDYADYSRPLLPVGLGCRALNSAERWTRHNGHYAELRIICSGSAPRSTSIPTSTRSPPTAYAELSIGRPMLTSKLC